LALGLAKKVKLKMTGLFILPLSVSYYFHISDLLFLQRSRVKRKRKRKRRKR
jgi:hypothetical protein